MFETSYYPVLNLINSEEITETHGSTFSVNRCSLSEVDPSICVQGDFGGEVQSAEACVITVKSQPKMEN